MIGFILQVILSKLNIFKGLSFISKTALEFTNLLLADFDKIIEGIQANSEVENTLKAFDDEFKYFVEEERCSRHQALLRINGNLFNNEGEPTEHSERIRNLATQITALGAFVSRVNDYHIGNNANKFTTERNISKIFRLNIKESSSLINGGTTNVSNRLGIKGMSLILTLVSGQLFLTLKYHGVEQELNYIPAPKDGDLECDDSLMDMDMSDAKVAYALKHCTQFIAGIVNMLLSEDRGQEKGLEGSQLANSKPKGGLERGGS